MNASQPSSPSPQPIPQRRVVPRPKRHLRQRSYQVMALETTAKIAVNFAISAAAISALIQLVPHYQIQQERLKEVRTEVKLMEERVDSLQQEFKRNFDPHQANSIRQQQAYRFDPHQLPIVFVNRDGKEVEALELLP
jgi:histone deacetylase complex regulatory component SIN3